MIKTRATTLTITLVGAMLAIACDTDDGPSPYDTELLGDWVDDDGRIQMRKGEINARELNGCKLNGRKLNGRKLNGSKLNGCKLNGAKLNGTALNNLRVVANQVVADDPQGDPLSGTELEDMRFEFEVDNEDETTSLYEESLTEIETAPGGLILATVKQRELPSGGWFNSCENGTKAVQLRGDWDPVTGDRVSTTTDNTTWGCLGTALGDCASWGYIPGADINGVDGSVLHQACTRMKRADYAGVGIPTTRNGTSIDVYDAAGLMAPDTTWPIEAMWNADGAVCVSHTRKSDWDLNDPPAEGKQYIGAELPPCVDVNEDGYIDFDDYPDAVLANRNVQTDPPL